VVLLVILAAGLLSHLAAEDKARCLGKPPPTPGLRSDRIPAVSWVAQATPQHEISLNHGKVTGGCSAVNASVVIRGGSADFDEIGFPRRSRPPLIASRPVTPTAAAICPLKATDWQLRPSIPKEPTRNPAGSSVHFLFEA
jgi:choline dehydrogenase-like flavoprotein